MNTCSIVSAFYYIGDTKFTYKDVTNFVDKMNNTKGKIDFCSIDALKEILGKLNTRLIDRQSLSLEAAIKIAENENFLNNLNRSKLSIFAGSYTSSVYPSAIFNLSTKGKGPNFVNATEFTNTVGNAAVSRACIWNQFRGEAYAISEGLHSGLNAVVDAYTNIKYNETNDAIRINSRMQEKYSKYINSYLVSNLKSIEIISNEIDKSLAIEEIVQDLNISENNVFTVGDGYSDIEMVKKFNGYCMKESIEDLKKVAKNEVSSVSEIVENLLNKEGENIYGRIKN